MCAACYFCRLELPHLHVLSERVSPRHLLVCGLHRSNLYPTKIHPNSQNPRICKSSLVQYQQHKVENEFALALPLPRPAL